MDLEQRTSSNFDEATRLQTLEAYEVLDTDTEQDFDDLAALASYICDTPISAISLVDANRQWFKASVGLEDRETPRDISFCQHAIMGEDLLVVPDALKDDRFKDSPLVTDGPRVRFYAGAPLVAPNGAQIGALCVKDTKPRKLTKDQLDALRRLARQVIGQLELRKTNTGLTEQAAILEQHAQDLRAATDDAVKAHLRTQEALDSLTESEERFRAFSENAVDAFFLHDTAGKILYVNREACQSLGYESDELVGMTIGQIGSNYDVTKHAEYLLALNSGKPLTLNGLHWRKDGTFFPVEVKITMFELQGEPCVLALCRDITERLKANEALRKGEERFNLVCCATNDVVWDFDLLSGDVWVSPNYGKLFGKGRKDRMLTLDDWRTGIHSEDRERVVSSFDRVLRSSDESWVAEYRCVKADGSCVDVLDRAFLIRCADGKPTRMIGAMMDVTERKRAEAIQRAKDQAERANRAKNQFLSRMSHELRTPLNSILGFAQLLEMYDPSAQQLDCVEQILRGGKHLLGLINEILDLSRIESGNMMISKEPVYVSEVVQEAVSLISPQTRELGIDVQIDEQIRDLFVHADRQRLLQVMINLLSNATKYNVPGGQVRIGAATLAEGRVALSVSDTGRGIDAEMSERVFMPFDRLGAELKGTEEGTGLGLALSKSLVEAMGGTIWFESIVGEGTTFWVEFASSEQPRMPEEAFQESEALLTCPLHKTILYVEDNGSNVTLMSEIFAMKAEWDLVVATTGQKGLSVAKDLVPDLVLLDLDLPDLGGIKVLSQLRRQPHLKAVPVIVVSADATGARIESAMQAGATAYITKPFDVHELLRTIAGVWSGEMKDAA